MTLWAAKVKSTKAELMEWSLKVSDAAWMGGGTANADLSRHTL
jgi:hypothetical protein